MPSDISIALVPMRYCPGTPGGMLNTHEIIPVSSSTTCSSPVAREEINGTNVPYSNIYE